MYGDHSLRDLQTIFDFPGPRLENPLPLVGLNPNWEQPVTRRELWAACAGIAGGRLSYVSDSYLTYVPFSAHYIEVNGELVPIIRNTTDPVISNNQTGMVFTRLSVLTPVMDANGAPLGSADVLPSTTYFAYVSNSKAIYAPNSLRLSTTAPTNPVSGSGSVLLEHGSVPGVAKLAATGRAMTGRYLGNTGNARNWRFVGYVRSDPGGLFVDTAKQRFVINCYNRRPLSLIAIDTTDSWVYSTLTWRPWNNSTANRVEFVANGEEPVALTFIGQNAGSGRSIFGIGLDSTTAMAADCRPNSSGGNSPLIKGSTNIYLGIPTEGYHYLQLLEAVSGNNTHYGDNGADGFTQAGANGWVMG